MEFLAKGEDDENNYDNELTKEESKLLWELPPPDKAVDDRHKDLLLQTNLSPNELQKRLFKIYQKAKSIFEEQGYIVSFLALGFLEWKEADQSKEFRKAPLILIPIQIEREGVKRSFKIEWNNEDILTNISLKAKLKEQGVELPEFHMPESKEGIYDYFQLVKNSISEMDGWNVQNDIYLSFFSFTKFVMYQDLDLTNWPEEFFTQDHPDPQSSFQSIF